MSVVVLVVLAGIVLFAFARNAFPRWGVRQRPTRNTITVSQRLSPDNQRRIGLLAASGQKIQAIQELRKITPADLATAKQTVEQLGEIYRMQSEKGV